jgi:hypothetical protein
LLIFQISRVQRRLGKEVGAALARMQARLARRLSLPGLRKTSHDA